MKILLALMAAAVVSLLAWVAHFLAQRAMRIAHGGGHVRGEVLSVEKVAYGQGRRHGIHLLMRTPKGKLSVQLGPTWFVDSQRMSLLPHDVIEVTGSRVSYDGKPTLIAMAVRKGNERLKLRTADGTPLWLASRAR